MGLFRKIFGRKNRETEQNCSSENLHEVTQQFAKNFESMDDNKISALEKILKENEPSSKKAALFHDFIEAGIEHSKTSKAEKVVNDYGQAIMTASEINKRKVEEFTKKLKDNDLRKYLNEEYAIYYHLQNKFDEDLLPYKKDVIREAIEFLIGVESKTEVIEQLKIGLLFLNDFIDFSSYKKC